MESDPVELSPRARVLARDTIVEALQHHRIEVIVCAVDDHHYHILARFEDDKPRKWVGIAKERSSKAVANAGLATAGGVWAVRCHCKPILNRAHQLEVVRYIPEHVEQGAALWMLGRVTDPVS
jgi:REP element-mobilizing transposase RayT